MIISSSGHHRNPHRLVTVMTRPRDPQVATLSPARTSGLGVTLILPQIFELYISSGTTSSAQWTLPIRYSPSTRADHRRRLHWVAGNLRQFSGVSTLYDEHQVQPTATDRTARSPSVTTPAAARKSVANRNGRQHDHAPARKRIANFR